MSRRRICLPVSDFRLTIFFEDGSRAMHSSSTRSGKHFSARDALKSAMVRYSIWMLHRGMRSFHKTSSSRRSRSFFFRISRFTNTSSTPTSFFDIVSSSTFSSGRWVEAFLNLVFNTFCNYVKRRRVLSTITANTVDQRHHTRQHNRTCQLE